jgi:hypothetical protein
MLPRHIVLKGVVFLDAIVNTLEATDPIYIYISLTGQFPLQADEIQGLLTDAATAGVPEELQSGLKRLFNYLQDASNDAESFATQARQDAQRHKPSDAVPVEAAAAPNGDVNRMDGVATGAAADAPVDAEVRRHRMRVDVPSVLHAAETDLTECEGGMHKPGVAFAAKLSCAQARVSISILNFMRHTHDTVIDSLGQKSQAASRARAGRGGRKVCLGRPHGRGPAAPPPTATGRTPSHSWRGVRRSPHSHAVLLGRVPVPRARQVHPHAAQHARAAHLSPA